MKVPFTAAWQSTLQRQLSFDVVKFAEEFADQLVVAGAGHCDHNAASIYFSSATID
jgi:hypothetical protein